MNAAIESLKSLSTFIPLNFVILLGITACMVLWVLNRRISREITQIDRNFAATISIARQKGPKPSKRERYALLLLDVANCIDEELKVGPSPKWLVHSDVTEAYKLGCVTALQGRNWIVRFIIGIGNSLTGISLIFTFGLIAWVLASDIPEAIRGVASNDLIAVNRGNESLRKAVGLMGAKFAISAVGLLFALIFRAFEAHFSNSLKEQAGHSIHGHLDFFSSRESHHVERLSHYLVRLEEATNRQTKELGDRLTKLGSIEVSVKDVGNEVKAHLGQIMKQSVADQICSTLADISSYADQAVTRMQDTLSENFAQATAHEMEQVRNTLDTIRTAIDNQGKGQIGSLIESMRDMMSGGFRSESQGMVEAMSGLREAIPRLDEQLRNMAADVDRNFRERNESTHRIQRELLTQMQATLDSNREAQAASQEAVARLLENAQISTVDLQNRIASSGEEMVTKLVNTAMSNFDDLRNQFEKLNKLAAGNVGDFSREVGSARDALAGIRTGLEGTLAIIQVMADKLRTGLDGNVAAATHTRQAMESYEKATQLVQTTTEHLTTSLTGLNERLRKEENLLVQQRDLAERIIPTLLTKYLEMIDQQSDQIRRAWSELSEKVERTIARSGDSLSEGVVDLGEQVEQLKNVLEKHTTQRG
jgi:Mg2+ and Co2+ transporter CorA